MAGEILAFTLQMGGEDRQKRWLKSLQLPSGTTISRQIFQELEKNIFSCTSFKNPAQWRIQPLENQF